MKKNIFLIVISIFSLIFISGCMNNSANESTHLLNETINNEIIYSYASPSFSYINFQNIGELMKKSPNPVKCRLVEIGEPELSEGYDLDNLKNMKEGDRNPAILAIYTPYYYKVIEEIIDGELNAGDIFMVAYSYGNYHGYNLEKSDSFINIEIDNEYLMFIKYEKDSKFNHDYTYHPLQGIYPVSYKNDINEYKEFIKDNPDVYRDLFGECENIEDIIALVKSTVKDIK